MQRRKITKADIPSIIELYNSGHSAYYIQDKLGFGEWSIRRALSKEGVKIRSRFHFSRKHVLNEAVFNQIDTEEKAYWLGFLYADGCVYAGKKGRMFHLTISDKDINHIVKFKAFFNTTIPLHHYLKKKHTGLFVWSKRIYEDLVKLGCHSRKSMTLEWPAESQVPKEFMRHFIRGFFDGDGSVSFNKKNSRCEARIISCLRFCDSYEKYLHEILGIKKCYHGKMSYSKVGNHPYTTRGIGSKDALRKFYDHLYADATIFLDRKRDVFSAYFSYISETKLGITNARKYESVELESPDGSRITLRNVRREAPKYGLGHGEIYDLIKGKRESYKGFTLKSVNYISK